ncbi:uncharacterized protein LOC129762701 [Toxorhynchites rutilus septentrionalis]|uniref:uncharacterized protein LOC129762701 n=1 Tax=Toxorhynchites rutilus septentrionalis TaxID=329112 RepID=UPI00247AF5F2|nr:uncharacterized protein LOC129762701 [Toxorhynchites rutilus septentrionalis]
MDYNNRKPCPPLAVLDNLLSSDDFSCLEALGAQQDYGGRSGGTAMKTNQLRLGARANQNVCSQPRETTISHGGPNVRQQTGTENEIPPQLLEEIYQLDDALEERGQRHRRGPVGPNQSLSDFERDLVAEMAHLFPSRVPVNRPIPALRRFNSSMNLQAVTSARLPLFCRQKFVPIISQNNTGAIPKERVKPTMICNPIQPPKPVVAKIRTIITKAPKRTIASTYGQGTGRVVVNSRITQTSAEGTHRQEPRAVDSRPVAVPTISTSVPPKQSRKQQLKSRSQRDALREAMARKQVGAAEDQNVVSSTGRPGTMPKPQVGTVGEKVAVAGTANRPGTLAGAPTPSFQSQDHMTGNRNQQQDTKRSATEARNSKKRSHAALQRRGPGLGIEFLPTAFNISDLLVCEVCRKTFRSQEQLDVHMNIHRAPFVCRFCKREFREVPFNHTCCVMKREMEFKMNERRTN